MAQSLLEDLPEQAFTDSTVKRMYELVNRAKTDAAFQKLIYGAVNGAMPGQWKNYRQELSTILQWARKVADYRRDPYGVELVQDVWATLDRKRGDCDDFTVLLCAAAEVLGCPCRIVTVSTRKDKSPGHVYPEAYVGGRWLGMDATMQGTSLGWQPSRVTDKKIWTRQELGLSGGENDLEGLGMMGNGYDVPGFKTGMRPVSNRLAPGVPDDISETYADPRRGNQVGSRRPIWHAPIATSADRTSNPRAGGGVYQPALPIRSMPTPAQIWSLIDRKYVPCVLDPDSAWWGKIPTSREDLNRMFPGSEGTMATYLRDIASVPASAIAEITNDVNRQLGLGEIGYHEVDDAIGEALEDYALGKMPRTKRIGVARKAPRKWRGQNPVALAHQKRPVSHPAAPHEKKYLIPGPRLLQKVRGGKLNGLGDFTSIVADLSKQVTGAVTSGVLPGDTTAVNTAINQAVDAALNQTPVAPKPATSIATVAKTAIPMGMLAALVGVAFLMTKGGKRKYRSNPSRRRSRSRRSSRRGSTNMQTMLLLGGGAAAAYYFLLRPGAAMQPKVPVQATALTAPKAPSTTSQVTSALVSIAPSLIDSIKNLFTTDQSLSAKTDESGNVTGNIQTDWSNL